MPATYAHYSFGRRVLEKLSDDKKELIEKNIELYDIGLHGPDILFFYKPYKKNKVKSEGGAIHARNAKDFIEKNIENFNRSDKHKSYTYGFLNHFALDQACHGYVGKVEEEGYEHTKIESEFDKSLLIKDGFNNPQGEDLIKHIIPSKENARVIKDFYEGISEDEILESLKSMVFYHDLLRSPGKVKRAVLNFGMSLLNFSSYQGLLISHEYDSRFDEYNEELYLRYMNGIDNAIDLIENFNRKNLDSNDLYLYNSESEWRGE